MILSKFVFMKIAPVNARYWRERGYAVKPTGGRAGKNTGQRIKVKVSDLPTGSNANVACRCDNCGRKFIQRYCRKTDICYNPCHKRELMLGNMLGVGPNPKKAMKGENHPRWNPNKSEYMNYSRTVRWLSEKTYTTNIQTLNPHNHPRTLCGVDGGYQLDHIVSVKEAYLAGWTPERASVVENLRMLPWEENRAKWSANGTPSF